MSDNSPTFVYALAEASVLLLAAVAFIAAAVASGVL